MVHVMTKAIRANLRRARKKAGLSQENMARAVGLSLQGYHLVETGQQSVKLDAALRIAERLGHDVSWMRELFAIVEGGEDTSENTSETRSAA